MGGKMNDEQRQEMDKMNADAKAKLDLEKTMDDFQTPLLPQDERRDCTGRPQVTNSLRYTQQTLAEEFQRIFDEEIMALRRAGPKEYAHDSSSPFANFERAEDDTGVDAKKVLWIFAMKNKDGIAAYIKGHTSQREDVRGRINDLIVYLLLLRGKINEEVGNSGNFGMGKLEK